MKKHSFLILLILSSCKLFAQSGPVKLNDLNIPTSPAFVFLDKAPASIEKPNNPKALSFSLMSLVNSSGAIEFTPYWFKNRPAYTFTDDVKNASPILQTLAFSLATTKNEKTTFLSAGFRTQLFRIYSPYNQKIIKDKMNDIVAELSNGTALDTNRIKELRSELNSLKRNTNFVFEIAGAYAGTSNDNKSLQSNKYGFWANVKWRPDNFPLDLTGLARYAKSYNTDIVPSTDTSYSDFGINISYAEDQFDLQLEWVNRTSKERGINYDRFVFVANYQVMPGAVIVASVGKDFGNVQNIYSALGIKFALSKEKMKIQ
jgi:hypothetical protein